MTEKKEHPQAKWLRALADGETLQVEIAQKWEDMTFLTALKEIAACTAAQFIRIKPRTITIGKYEVVEPMKAAPKRGTEYYYLDAIDAAAVCLSSWDDDTYDLRALSVGMAWLQREDAELAAKAITELLTGNKESP